jgi:hypothetical protein
MRKFALAFFALVLSGLLMLNGCMSVSLKSPDGSSTISGSIMNGSVSYSSGEACTPAVPSPVTPIPVQSASPVVMTPRMICDANGGNCKPAMMAVADTQAPTCNTQVVNVRGTDISTYFGWTFAALAAAVVAVAAGS